MRFVIAFILCICCFNSIKAIDISYYRFHKMPETSYFGGIHSIGKDSIGRMWFSGYDAVFVYDGTTYVSMNEAATRFYPSANWAFGQVAITKKNKQLFVATNQGLLHFNYQKKEFEMVAKGNIGPIASLDDGAVCFVRNGLVEVLFTDKSIRKFEFKKQSPLEITSLVSLNKEVYVAAKERLFKLDINRGKLSAIIDLDGNKTIKDALVFNGNIFVLTSNEGLYKCSLDGKILRYYPIAFGNQLAPNCKGIYKDDHDILWISTQMGLFLLDPKNGDSHMLRSSNLYPFSLPNNSVWSIYPDPDGGVWIGTYGGKLAYMTFFDNDINYFNASLGGLNHPIVSCFEEDVRGNLWIGTEGGGVNYWNRSDDKFEYYNQGNQNAIHSNMVKSLHYLPNNNSLQASMFNGGIVEITHNQKVQNLDFYYPNSNQLLTVYDFVIDKSGTFWMSNPDAALSTANNGNKTVQFITILDEVEKPIKLQIETIFLNGDSLWLMTRSGIYVINKLTQKVIHHFVIPNTVNAVNNICCYYMVSKEEGWFGTHGGGVNRLMPDGEYINYSEKDGLFGKMIFGILRDPRTKQVWFSTNDGLYYFKESDNKIYKFPMDVSVLCGTFYLRSCFETSKGEMLFGGTNGFLMFKPIKIQQNHVLPSVFITDLFVNNQKVTLQDNIPNLNADISTLTSDENSKPITLSHQQNSIELKVASNSYLQADKNQFAYRMVGLSDKWNLLPRGQKSIPFFNLPAGKYIFEIKAANNDGVWSNKVTTLVFKVKPSPFLSVWAYLFYLSAFLLLLYFLWKYFTNKRIYQEQLLLEQQKEQNMRKLSQARTDFFTHISHDLKTPLTLVLDPVKQLKENFTKNNTADSNKYLQLIERNVYRIQHIISQLLQFREIESQKITLNPTAGDLIQYVKEIFSLFELYANKNHIETDIQSELSSFYTRFDHDIIEKIFTNLFSNAIKYNTENGFIGVKIHLVDNAEISPSKLTLKQNVKYLNISIQNTGVGIPEDKIGSIFEAFEKRSTSKLNFESSTGLGLSIVKELIHHLEGTVTATSTNSIVTFNVVLPFVPLTEIHKGEDESYEYTITEINSLLDHEQFVSTKNSANRKLNSIVIIEDDATLRNYMEQRLSSFYNVYTSVNGMDGINKTEKIFPQLVITDLKMPEADGYEVCRTLHSNIKTSHIPIIALSAVENANDKIKALECGANIFLEKPFEMDYLLKQIENLLSRQEGLKAAYSKKFIADPSKVTISSTDEDILKRAMDAIEKNMDNVDYNVEAFVSEMGIGRTLLYQKINDILGMSIKEFIMDIRLKRSAQLLQDSELTIAEVAYATGFNNPKYFSICFKKQYNTTPTEFRKKV